MSAHPAGVAPPDPVRRTLKLSIADGALYAVMIGLAESYLGAFAVELGHQDTALALLATVPLLVGAVAQLASGPLARLAGSWRRMVVIGAVLQALSQVGFIVIALTGDDSLVPLLLTKTVFWTSGAVIGPVWNAWMTDLVEGRTRERFFAWRGAAGYLALVIAYVVGGVSLQRARAASTLMLGFAVLFGVAIVARFASAACLALHVDAARELATAPGGAARIRTAARLGRWRIAALVAVMGFGVHVSSPFYTPYILRDLQLDFTAYAGLTAIAILVKALVFPLTHRVATRVGLAPLVLVSGVGLATLPVLWAFIQPVWALGLVEIFSGVAWAGFEFASVQLLLAAAPASCRVEFLSLAGAVTGVAQLAGALFGSWILATFALDYTDVFALSGVLRLCAVLGVALPLVPALGLIPLRRLWVIPGSVRAVAGVMLRPIVRNRRATIPPTDDDPTPDEQG